MACAFKSPIFMPFLAMPVGIGSFMFMGCYDSVRIILFISTSTTLSWPDSIGAFCSAANHPREHVSARTNAVKKCLSMLFLIDRRTSCNPYPTSNRLGNVRHQLTASSGGDRRNWQPWPAYSTNSEATVQARPRTRCTSSPTAISPPSITKQLSASLPSKRR